MDKNWKFKKGGTGNWKPNLYNEAWIYGWLWTRTNVQNDMGMCKHQHFLTMTTFGNTLAPPHKNPKWTSCGIANHGKVDCATHFCHIHKIKPFWNPANILHGLSCAATLPRIILVHNHTGVFCGSVGLLCPNDVFKEWVQMVLQMDCFFADLIPVSSFLVINRQLQPGRTRLRRVYIRFTKCPEPWKFQQVFPWKPLCLGQSAQQMHNENWMQFTLIFVQQWL